MTDLLDRSVADLDRAEERCADDLLPHFGAELEPVQTDPRDDRAQSDDQRGEQTVTLLQLLGYLREPSQDEVAAGSCLWTATEIEVAWSDWRRDRLALAAAEEPALIIHTGEPEPAGLDEDSLRRDLKACASLEGEVTLTRWPEPGAVTLASRVALMRLRVFGLREEVAGVAMPRDAESTLIKQARRITAGLDLAAVDMVNHLGDIGKINTAVRKRMSGRYAILWGPEDGDYPAPVKPLVVPDGKKVRALNLKNDAMADWNRFFIRLLQVRLWTLEYYRCEVDGRWGELSCRALAAYLQDYGVRRRDELIGRVKGEFVVLAISRLLEHFAREVDRPAETLERKKIDAMLSRKTVANHIELWDRLAEVHDEQQATDMESPPVATYVGDDFQIAGPANIRRRRYFGWRGIFAAFGRFLRKAANKVAAFVRRLLDAVKQGLGYVRSIVRYIVDASRAAMRVVSLAITRLRHWFTGTPVVTFESPEVPAVATLWQRDFDTINLVGRGAAPEIRARHRQVIAWMQRSVGILLEIGAQLLGLVLSFGNWLLFAWNALQTVREIVRAAQDPLFAELVAADAVV